MKNRTFKSLMDLVFPPDIYCICCGSYIEPGMPYSLCAECIEKIHWANGRNCIKCGKPLQDTFHGDRCYDCLEMQHSFRKGYTCTGYGLLERAVLMDLKYREKPYIAEFLSDAMADMISWKRKWDVVISVPISGKRMQKRGFNQADLLASGLASRLEIPYIKKALVRTRDTVPMRGLDAAQRHSNIAGAFALTPEAKASIKGRDILLVDDIFTTGSTLDECSRVLKANGASAVDVYTFAAGANRQPGADVMRDGEEPSADEQCIEYDSENK